MSSAIHNVYPYLCVKNVDVAIDFYRRAFGASEHFRLTEPGGKVGHAEIYLGSDVLMLAEEYPEQGFKFTHDPWSEISRERDEFPDELQIVGWYHTHPDWGVFLSGMDMFICDNFFNKRLDVALVIAP